LLLVEKEKAALGLNLNSKIYLYDLLQVLLSHQVSLKYTTQKTRWEISQELYKFILHYLKLSWHNWPVYTWFNLTWHCLSYITIYCPAV